MVGVRRALIVATDEYSDPKLTSLSAPARDALLLADVLRDADVGGFGVETVFNRPAHEVELAIAEFFGSGKYGDTLLAHFSCHGVKSPSGELYFATTDTDLSDSFKLKVTGVPSALVRDALEESRASLILCLVDCCYSGAFVKLAKAADTVDLTERLGGKGRAIITASTSLQLALDGEEEPSLFTHAVIDGLRTGEADRDLDGLISLDELYNFVHERVTTRNPNQTPVKSFDVQGEVYVARRSTPVTRPAPLEPDLLADAHSSVTYKRMGAVQGLGHILAETHPGRSLAARLELSRLAGRDDSLSVRDQARTVLEAAGEPPTPAIPAYEPASTRGGGATVDDPPVAADPDEETSAAETDTDTETRTGAGGRGGGGDRGRGDDDSGPAEHRRTGTIVLGVIGALGLIGVLVIGAITWLAPDDDGATSGAEIAGPVLPVSEILLRAKDPGSDPGIVALDIDTGQTRPVISDPGATLPTISEDRQWVVYLTDAESWGGVPRVARVDGSDDARLLDAEASNACPYTTRPAFSVGGERLAAICLGTSGETLGLATIDRDGHLLDLVRQAQLSGAPTWTGEDRIVVMRDAEGDGTTTLWEISPDGGQPEPITDGRDGSDSHPDWSARGLLFLRDQDGATDVFYLDDDQGGLTRVTTSGRVDSPTWGSGEDPSVVWLEPTEDGAMTLRLDALDGEPPIEVDTAEYGPPAWGSR